MQRFAISAYNFCSGLCGPIAAGVAAISDPLHWLKAVGVVSDDTVWLIPLWARQSILLAFGFIWLLIWYHKQRINFEDGRPPVPDMPLHQVARHIARDSNWAADYKWPDDEWVIRVDRELMSKLLLGHIQAFGSYRPDNHAFAGPEREIELDFLKGAEWHAHDMVSKSPPSTIFRPIMSGGGEFKNVMFDQRQVERVWPKKNFWQRMRGQSPIDRISRSAGNGYDDIFKEQDQNHSKLTGQYQSPTLEEILA